MKYCFLFLTLLAFSPLLTRAQETGSLQELLTGIGGFLNAVVIPFLLAIAFLVFVVNAVRFFVLGATTDDGKKNAKNLAIYGIATFVFILSFWGLVNLLVQGIGLNSDPCIPVSDYISGDGTSCPPPQGILIDTSRFGVDVPGSPPPGNVVGPPNPAGPGVALPSNDRSPLVLPSTSFTLEDGVFIDAPPATPSSYAAVLSIADAVRRQSASYFQTQVPRDYGINASQVMSSLFADLHTTHQTNISELGRASAIYRLSALGVISDQLVLDYINAVNEFYILDGSTRRLDITEVRANGATPQSEPSAVVSNRMRTIEMINDEVSYYNVNLGLWSWLTGIREINATETINTLYDTNQSTPSRHDYLVNLTSSMYTIDYRGDRLQFYDTILTDINTQTIYLARYNEIITERASNRDLGR